MEALEAGKVNLAIVRSDSALQGRTHTVMIMRREAAVMLAPKVGKVQKVADLQNATIGVTREGPLDGSLLAPVLDYYGITRDKARYVAVPGDEVAERVPAEEDRRDDRGRPGHIEADGRGDRGRGARRSRARSNSSRSRRPMRSRSASRRWNRSRSSRARSAAGRRARPRASTRSAIRSGW